MDDGNLFRRIARRTPAPLDGIIEYGAGALDDLVRDHRRACGRPARRLGPRAHPPHAAVAARVMRRTSAAEVRRPGEHPRGEPSLLVGNRSGGLMIPDTFVFSAAFYEHFGADRRFHSSPTTSPPRPADGPGPALRRRPPSRDAARRVRARRPGLVCPGGDYRRSGRLARDKMVFGGRRGLVRLALERDVPTSRRRDRRARDGAFPHPRPAGRGAARARQADAHRGAARRTGPRSASTRSTCRAASRCRRRSRSTCCRRSTCGSATGATRTLDTAYEITARDAGGAQRAGRGAEHCPSSADPGRCGNRRRAISSGTQQRPRPGDRREARRHPSHHRHHR